MVKRLAYTADNHRRERRDEIIRLPISNDIPRPAKKSGRSMPGKGGKDQTANSLQDLRSVLTHHFQGNQNINVPAHHSHFIKFAGANIIIKTINGQTGLETSYGLPGFQGIFLHA